jgi:hypothetical protein
VPKLIRSLNASLCLLNRPEGPGGVRSGRLDGERGRPKDGVPGADPGVMSPTLSALEGVPRTDCTRFSTSILR